MSTDFTFFEGAASVNSATPRVTVRKTGQLVLTEAAVAMLSERVEAAQIGFELKARAVGIRPSVEGGRGVLKLRRQPNGRSRLIYAKKFLAHHELAVEKARGPAVEEFGGGLVGFRLPGDTAAMPEALTARTLKGSGQLVAIAALWSRGKAAL